MNSIKHEQFANGFQVIYEKPNNNIPISSVRIICNIGNIHTSKELNGVTHFIEHMCFKGTNHHPDFNKVLLQYVDSGAIYNGFSTQRYTTFVVKCQDTFLPHCIKIMAEELLQSKFDLTEFKKEENVVIEEAVINSDKPAYILSNMSMQALYENTPYQYPVDDISYHKKKYDYKKVVQFYKEHYIPANMIFSITTNVPLPSILNMLKKSPFNKKEKPVSSSLHLQMMPYFLIPPTMNGVKYNIKIIKKLNSIFLNVAFQVCNQFDPEKYILNFFANILCNALTGRLSKLLRQDYGLVYGIRANTNFYECGGDFTISTQFNSDSFLAQNRPSVLPLIIRELNKLIKSGITTHELNTFKHNIRGITLIDLEDSSTQTSYNGQMLLSHTPEEIVPYSQLYKIYYEPITKAQVNACIRKYIRSERMCITAIGHINSPIAAIEAECNKLVAF
jgi:predicted Zn-dependent peptidase